MATTAVYASKVDYKLKLLDPKKPVLVDAGRDWLDNMKVLLNQWAVEDDIAKVSTCIRILTGFFAEAAKQHGRFESFESFVDSFNDPLFIPKKPQTIEYELRNAVKEDSYQKYSNKFLDLYTRNEACE